MRQRLMPSSWREAPLCFMYSPTTLPRSARIYKPISAPTSDSGTVVTSTLGMRVGVFVRRW